MNSDWIPIDQLPDKEVEVLIAEPFQSSKDAPIEYTLAISYWDGTYSSKKTFGKNHVPKPQFPDGQDEQPGYYWPTHWMSLPKPPKPI